MKIFASPKSVEILDAADTSVRATPESGGQGILRAVIFPYVISRVLVMCILLAAPLVVLTPVVDGVRGVKIRPQGNYYHEIENSLLPGDAVPYRDIAEHGYSSFKLRNWFPLFPLLWRSAALVTHEFAMTGSVLSNLLFLIGLVLLYKVIPLFGYSESTAARSILYLTIFPTSHFFSVPLTESLFLTLTAGAFYAAAQDRWTLAGICGALASLTRFPGVLLLPPLLLLCYLHRHKGMLTVRNIVSVLLVPAGTVAYFTYLRLATGDFFAYPKAQAMIYGGVDANTQTSFHMQFFLSPLFRYILHPRIFHQWSFLPLQFAMALAAILSLGILVKRKQWVLAVYLAGSIVVPLSGGLIGSFTRFMMVCFPVVVTLAEFGENHLVDQAIRLVFAGLLAVLTLACALKFGMGMA